jgi:hypothetical protein
MAAFAFAPRLLPRTVLQGIHCQENTAGFWVSRSTSRVARRPWCLPCSQQLDPGRCAVNRSAARPPRAAWRRPGRPANTAIAGA